MQRQVCIDSNALTYLVEPMIDGCCPVGAVAEEKIALLRIYLYRDEILYASPTVRAEYGKIKDELRKRHHLALDNVLLGDIPVSDKATIDTRAGEYTKMHPQINDCYILAESELGGADVLLTYDQKFLRRLRDNTHKIELYTPTEFWVQLGIPRGIRPNRSPHPSNPLANETWWVWE